MTDAAIRTVPKTLGRLDLILLKIVAIVNLNNVPPAAVYGRAALGLWTLAFLAFFVPEAVAVIVMAKRYPGEGGIYLWIREEFGPGHGFLAGWCYWTNNLFYVPVLLVYLAGIFAYAGGTGTARLVEDPAFVATVAFGWLALITLLNVRGMAIGKWIQNVGGIGTALAIGLVLVAGLVVVRSGTVVHPPLFARTGWEVVAGFSVMCNAMVGIELASTMGDEIRDPGRDLRPAIFIAGAVALGSYLLVTAVVLALVPIDRLGAIQGVIQAVSTGARTAHVGWIVAPLALLLGLSIGGAASAWFAGSSRIPFAAGLLSALPVALGRVHPRWGSPHVALLTGAVLAAVFTALSLLGSSVAEAYQVLLKAAVVIQLVPFVYLFLALARLASAGAAVRAAGLLGLVTTVVGILAAFVPTAEVGSAARFELKLALGVAGPVGVGWALYRRSVGRAGSPIR